MIRTILLCATVVFVSSIAVFESLADQMGLTALQSATTNLNGSGIRLAQPEAEVSDPPPAFEVDPSQVGQPVTLFTYISALGTNTGFPNSVGVNSGHADGVGARIYGMPAGMATNVAHVDSMDANSFYTNYVASDSLPDLGDSVINQSFTFGSEPGDGPNQVTVSEQEQIDSQYDNYAVQNNTLFISAANNGGAVSPPATSYNCIGVGVFGAGTNSGWGPTLDNGRCKPDINAPGGDTSTSTSEASGAAVLLMQAAARGDGGADTASAGDMRTVKALMLNGAVKPVDWTNGTTSPLDARYGAGVLNIFNAYEQLIGGRHGYSGSEKVLQGASHPPGTFSSPINAFQGWDFNTNTSSAFQDSINHYYFDVANSSPGTVFTATSTLVWNRAYNPTYMINQGAINNLNLYLYDASSGNLVASSVSTVDNVQHVYIPRLPAGRYDLQVWKAGGLGISSASETYALAFDFFSTQLMVSASDGNVMLSWPLYPDGFGVQGATDLLSQQWSTNYLPPTLISGTNNVATLSPTNGYEFFRLQRPDF
jgi:hypothetical protein